MSAKSATPLVDGTSNRSAIASAPVSLTVSASESLAPRARVERAARRTHRSGEISGRGGVITMSVREPLNIWASTRLVTSDYLAAPPATVIVKLTALQDAGMRRLDWPRSADS